MISVLHVAVKNEPQFPSPASEVLTYWDVLLRSFERERYLEKWLNRTGRTLGFGETVDLKDGVHASAFLMCERAIPDDEQMTQMDKLQRNVSNGR